MKYFKSTDDIAVKGTDNNTPINPKIDPKKKTPKIIHKG